MTSREPDQKTRYVMAGDLHQLAHTEDAHEALRQAIAFSSADWGQARDLAWIYGIVLGWDCDPEDLEDEGAVNAMDEMAIRHGWDVENVARLRRLHAAFNAPPTFGTDLCCEEPA